jgi:DNA-binding transcriptional LysR family regulator
VAKAISSGPVTRSMAALTRGRRSRRPRLDDPTHLLAPEPSSTLAEHRDSRWIAGCERCRRELLDLCAAADFTPHIAYNTDDMVVMQALVAAGLGFTALPGQAVTR